MCVCVCGGGGGARWVVVAHGLIFFSADPQWATSISISCPFTYLLVELSGSVREESPSIPHGASAIELCWQKCLGKHNR